MVTPTIRLLPHQVHVAKPSMLPGWDRNLPFWSTQRFSKSIAKIRSPQKEMLPPPTPRRYLPQRPSALPQTPSVNSLALSVDSDAEYAVVVSMYEVYNDRIFDLLSSATLPTPALNTRQATANQKDSRRRPLLFKPTEASPDRKVVAGLRKVVCGTYEEALMVLETGLMERRVAGTGSNSASSRSHGFFCVEVKKKHTGYRYGEENWTGGTMTIVDLAGELGIRL